MKVLVSLGEDTDHSSVTPIRLSSYLSASSVGVDQSPSTDTAPEAAATIPVTKSKENEPGAFPDIPFRVESDQDDNVVLKSSKPPAKPVFKPIEGCDIHITYVCTHVHTQLQNLLHKHTPHRYTYTCMYMHSATYTEVQILLYFCRR